MILWSMILEIALWAVEYRIERLRIKVCTTTRSEVVPSLLDFFKNPLGFFLQSNSNSFPDSRTKPWQVALAVLETGLRTSQPENTVATGLPTDRSLDMLKNCVKLYRNIWTSLDMFVESYQIVS